MAERRMPNWARAGAKAGLAVLIPVVVAALESAVEGFIKDKLGDEAKTRNEKGGK